MFYRKVKRFCFIMDFFIYLNNNKKLLMWYKKCKKVRMFFIWFFWRKKNREWIIMVCQTKPLSPAKNKKEVIYAWSTSVLCIKTFHFFLLFGTIWNVLLSKLVAFITVEKWVTISNNGMVTDCWMVHVRGTKCLFQLIIDFYFDLLFWSL
jgi:hypothetical protein